MKRPINCKIVDSTLFPKDTIYTYFDLCHKSLFFRFTDAITKEKRKFFKEKNNENVRVEFFPIEWRSKLVLDEGKCFC